MIDIPERPKRFQASGCLLGHAGLVVHQYDSKGKPLFWECTVCGFAVLPVPRLREKSTDLYTQAKEDQHHKLVGEEHGNGSWRGWSTVAVLAVIVAVLLIKSCSQIEAPRPLQTHSIVWVER